MNWPEINEMQSSAARSSAPLCRKNKPVPSMHTTQAEISRRRALRMSRAKNMQLISPQNCAMIAARIQSCGANPYCPSRA